MKIQHNCLIPRLELPEDVTRVENRWHCPECGQYWIIIYRHGSMKVARTVSSGLKNWWWQRKMRKELK